MSLKKFNKFPSHFHWKDALGCSSLLFGLFLATLSVQGSKNPEAPKKETVASMAEKQLHNIIPKTISKSFEAQGQPLVGPPKPSNLNSVAGQEPPFQGFIKKVFNKKLKLNVI